MEEVAPREQGLQEDHARLGHAAAGPGRADSRRGRVHVRVQRDREEQPRHPRLSAPASLPGLPWADARRRPLLADRGCLRHGLGPGHAGSGHVGQASHLDHHCCPRLHLLRRPHARGQGHGEGGQGARGACALQPELLAYLCAGLYHGHAHGGHAVLAILGICVSCRRHHGERRVRGQRERCGISPCKGLLHGEPVHGMLRVLH
mmetsp:Transcript_87766/g.261729  ORF Transcript_87766/g.261729 Transcript_87766/m.261729 type:complete len:204 (+) Transcript_87766:290-901(+)